MTTPDPAATLRAAAARLRALATEARSPGPYSVKSQCLCDRWDEDVPRCESREHRAVAWHVRSVAPAGSSWISHQVVETNHEGDARWLALLSPHVAEPLAAWLDETAASAERHVPIWRFKRPEGWDGEFGDPWVPRPDDEFDSLVRGHYGSALAVAHAVLGDAPADGERGA